MSQIILGIGMLLITGGSLLIRYGVERSDYLHVIFVLLAFLPFAGGGFLLLYVGGLFSP